MQYLSVKNFEKYQHYKTRRPPWVKLYAAVLDDPAFIALSEIDQSRYVKLLVIASQQGNRICNDATYLQKMLRSPRKPDLTTLLQAGFLIPWTEPEPRGTSGGDSVSLSVSDSDSDSDIASRKHNASKKLAPGYQKASTVLAEIADKVFPPIP